MEWDRLNILLIHFFFFFSSLLEVKDEITLDFSAFHWLGFSFVTARVEGACLCTCGNYSQNEIRAAETERGIYCRRNWYWLLLETDSLSHHICIITAESCAFKACWWIGFLNDISQCLLEMKLGVHFSGMMGHKLSQSCNVFVFFLIIQECVCVCVCQVQKGCDLGRMGKWHNKDEQLTVFCRSFRNAVYILTGRCRAFSRSLFLPFSPTCFLSHFHFQSLSLPPSPPVFFTPSEKEKICTQRQNLYTKGTNAFLQFFPHIITTIIELDCVERPNHK